MEPVGLLLSCILRALLIDRSSSLSQLNFGVDESYKLSVPATGNPLYAQIEVSALKSQCRRHSNC